MSTLARIVARHAAVQPHDVAFVDDLGRLTWREYDERSTGLASALAASGVAAGDRVAVLLPDGAAVHVCYLAIEKAGGVIVGIGPRAGDREIEHLLAKSGATLLLAEADRAELADRVGIGHRIVGDEELRHAVAHTAGAAIEGRGMGPNDLWLLNSTSGTTGLPKCVMHHQARWFAFHELAVGAGALRAGDVFMSVVPAPFGFGIWTAHVTPTVLGAPCVLMPRFDADECLERIERERVTVLAAVSTQVLMLVNAATYETRDLSSLRVVFTGGERVPYDAVAELEERTACAVLQFYGSNETGALSRTTLTDDRERRLRTAGRIIPHMRVRLLDERGSARSAAAARDVTATGGPGLAVCKGPLTCLGYYEDPEANAALVTADGWMRTGDVCALDPDGYLSVVGRASDFIIRGGKNISAAQVEEEVATHPAVALAAAVAVPDPVFGERVCVFVECRTGGVEAEPALTLEDLQAHLASRGVGKELWPERLEVVANLPRSSGGKVAKGELRALAARTSETAE
ncbi:MAG: class I adenylate-forming enzyme family protein [Acidimicrobiia bacterium]